MSVAADLDAIRRQYPNVQIDQDNADKLARLAVDPHSQETYGGYLAQIAAKQQARAAPTSGRPFDSQGPMYDQATNQLSPAGRAALAQRGAPMAGQTLGTMTGLVPQAQPMGRTPALPMAGPPRRPQTLPDWMYLSAAYRGGR